MFAFISATDGKGRCKKLHEQYVGPPDAEKPCVNRGKGLACPGCTFSHDPKYAPLDPAAERTKAVERLHVLQKMAAKLKSDDKECVVKQMAGEETESDAKPMGLPAAPARWGIVLVRCGQGRPVLKSPV